MTLSSVCHPRYAAVPQQALDRAQARANVGMPSNGFVASTAGMGRRRSLYNGFADAGDARGAANTSDA